LALQPDYNDAMPGTWQLPKEARLTAFAIGAQLAVRAGLSAGLSVGIATALHMAHPLYAVIAAIIVTDLSPSRSRHLGLHRIVATVIGSICGGLCISLLPSASWAVGLGVAVAMLSAEVLQGPDGVRIAAFVFTIIVVDHSDQVWPFVMDRFIETILGIAVAWSVSHVPKLMRLDDAKPDEAKPQDSPGG
jgi:uncharacterized membrane protein YgaE (UPF0421/DUF939 family)